MSDKTLAKCPKCGTRGQRQISGGAGLVFKGSGFYITDYKRAGDKSSSGDTDSGKSDPSAKPKSDTKGSGADS
jgi:predicted nucleic acid-binding Zn ribbon protein